MRLTSKSIYAWAAICLWVCCSSCTRHHAVVPQEMATAPPRPLNVPSAARIGGTVPTTTVTIPEPPVKTVSLSNPWAPEGEIRDWNYIVLHHTATSAGSVEQIHEEHLGRGWEGVGYHFVIGNGDGMGDGEIEPTFRWREQMHGAHAGKTDYNQHGIGVVLIGNFEETSPTAAQLEAVTRLVSTLKREYGITTDHVIPHSDVKATACPGKNFPLAQVAATSPGYSLSHHQKVRSPHYLAGR